MTQPAAPPTSLPPDLAALLADVGPGESFPIHFLAPISIPTVRGFGRVMRYGDELAVTREILEASLDRLGRSWLDLLADEDAQVRRWGKVAFRSGPWPADKPRQEPGSIEFAEAREIARSAAHTIADPNERAKALREVEAVYGKLPPTNTTLASYGEPRGVEA